jgi:CysZ protein
MFQDALDSLLDIFSPPFRRVVLKSLGLTLAVLIAIYYAVDRFALSFVTTHTGWLAAMISILVGFGLFIALALLAAPTTSLVASFFLDEIAELVEREVDPGGAPGKPAPALEAALFSLRFAGLTAAATVAALVLLLIPGIGFAAWIAVNAYLLGGEYFELAAMRFGSMSRARKLRQQSAGQVYFAGLIIAGFVAIPLLNLLTPLFATALMTRLHKRLTNI